MIIKLVEKMVIIACILMAGYALLDDLGSVWDQEAAYNRQVVSEYTERIQNRNFEMQINK